MWVSIVHTVYFQIHPAVSKIVNPSIPHATLCYVPNNKVINKQLNVTWACHRVDMWLGIVFSLATIQCNRMKTASKTLTITSQDKFPGTPKWYSPQGKHSRLGADLQKYGIWQHKYVQTFIKCLRYCSPDYDHVRMCKHIQHLGRETEKYNSLYVWRVYRNTSSILQAFNLSLANHGTHISNTGSATLIHIITGTSR